MLPPSGDVSSDKKRGSTVLICKHGLGLVDKKRAGGTLIDAAGLGGGKGIGD